MGKKQVLLLLGLCLLHSAATWPMTFFIGGDFEGQPWGNDGHVARCTYSRKEGCQCFKMGQGLHNGRVYAIAARDRKHVFATGSFHDKPNDISFIAMWDGVRWQGLGGGLTGGVGRTITLYQDKVYVGGDFVRAGQIRANFVAMWDGEQWHALQDGAGARAGLGGRVNALVSMHQGGIVAGGPFPTVLGDTNMQFLSVWSPSRNTWVQPELKPFPHEVVALARGLSSPPSPATTTTQDDTDQPLFAAGRYDMRRYDYSQRRWIVNFKIARNQQESEFRINALAVSNFTLPHTRENEMCVVVGGYFEGAAVVRNKIESDDKNLRHMGRWCRSSTQWDSFEGVPKKKQIFALAASANGEVLAGWENGLGIWDFKQKQLVKKEIRWGGVYAISVVHDPIPADQLDHVLQTIEKNDIQEVVDDETGETKQRIKIKKKGDKQKDQFLDSLKNSVYGLRVVNSWDQTEPAHIKTRKMAQSIHSAADAKNKKQKKSDDVEVETDTEEEQHTSQNIKSDADMFEGADSIIIDKEELQEVERVRAQREREEKKERMRLRRYERSTMFKLAKLVGSEESVQTLDLDTLDMFDGLLESGFFIGQILLLIGIAWFSMSKLDQWFS